MSYSSDQCRDCLFFFPDGGGTYTGTCFKTAHGKETFVGRSCEDFEKFDGSRVRMKDPTDYLPPLKVTKTQVVP